jgi:hypothetical protein
MLLVTVPLRLLLAVAVVTLKALLNVPVEPLLSAAERAALAAAAPDLLLRLLSDGFAVDVFVAVLVLVLVLLPVVLCWSVVLADATPLKPNATAMAEARSVFFMKPPKVIQLV